MKKLLHLSILLFILLLCSACERIAILTTPTKQPNHTPSALSEHAESVFWETLHQGHYAHISDALYLLTAAYLQNPNNPNLAAHLGFTHIWQLAERQRLNPVSPRSVDDSILARKFFADAVQLNPNDARYLGFYGDSLLVEGKIFNNPRQQVKAYFILKRAIAAWPEFNYFTAAYPMSILPRTDKHFAEAVEWEWKNLDRCAGTTVNRQHPDFTPYMARETQQGPQRACWNSWIAPYNFEGFFLNMGDMVVKQGDWKTGVLLYRNAQLAKNYSQWPYRHVLEQRIAQAHENVRRFNIITSITELPPEPTMMFNSSFACMACHKARATQF